MDIMCLYVSRVVQEAARYVRKIPSGNLRETTCRVDVLNRDGWRPEAGSNFDENSLVTRAPDQVATNFERTDRKIFD